MDDLQMKGNGFVDFFKKWKKPMLFLIAAGILYCGFLQFKMNQYANAAVPEKADYIIILGARVKGTTPSLSLQKRIDAALPYLKMNRGTMVIASGGKGRGEDISEAQAIQEALVNAGIEKDRIILEDRSTTTWENFSFSKPLIKGNGRKIVCVTNSYHIYRAVLMAEKQGLHVTGLAAKTPIESVLKSYVREYLAITKYKAAGEI
ncbi:YdcF family protein [Peribacillus sp. SCS-37]|uniref:YdcF family protein n=1 Tax=Paraperibacillus esterisolvens TaxID=3115296 RepID=UPI00390589EA